MGFWEEHGETEAALAEAERAKLPPSSLDAPGDCLECGHVGTDVFFGSCAGCFQTWEASRKPRLSAYPPDAKPRLSEEI